MLVLLPPSEGKTPAPAGAPPLALESLSSPGLTETRREVLAALRELSGRPEALELLKLPPGLAEELARNVDLHVAPAASARSIYSGVLFAASGLAELEGRALERAGEHVRIVSALWGLISPLDHIPAYRLAMAASLPGVGPLARAWREPLARELDPLSRDRLVVDCRSSSYLAAWRPGKDASAWVPVRVVRGGKVISHHAKHTRGVLTRHLLTRPDPMPSSPEALLVAARELAHVERGVAPAGWHVRGAELRAGPGRFETLEVEVG